jgi:hypothetical protein
MRDARRPTLRDQFKGFLMLRLAGLLVLAVVVAIVLVIRAST